MRQFARLFMVALSMTILALVVIFVPHKDVNAQSPTQVQVVNTPLPVTVRGIAVATPVPVTVRGIAVGAPLPVSGTVSVANFPSTQTVSNTGSAPLFVRDVDSAGRNPFSVESNNIGSGSGASVALPSGTASVPIQTVVIEFVSALCQEGTAPGDIYLTTFLAGSPTDFFLAATGNGVVLSNPNGWTEITVAQQTRIYASPGTQARIGTPFPNNGCIVSLSGHLIPQ